MRRGPFTGKVNLHRFIFGHVPDLIGGKIWMRAFVDAVCGHATGIVRILFGDHASLPIKYALPFECESFQEILESLLLGGDWNRLSDLWRLGLSCLRTSHRIAAPQRRHRREVYRVRDGNTSMKSDRRNWFSLIAVIFSNNECRFLAGRRRSRWSSWQRRCAGGPLFNEGCQGGTRARQVHEQINLKRRYESELLLSTNISTQKSVLVVLR